MDDISIPDTEALLSSLQRSIRYSDPLLTINSIDEIIDYVNAVMIDDDALAPNFVPITRLDVLTSLVHGPDRSGGDYCRDSGINEIVDAIKATILKMVHEKEPIDPWPGLTRADVRAMIGSRRGIRNRAVWWIGDNSKRDEPLTLEEKLLAARHRQWLEKGARKRRAA